MRRTSTFSFSALFLLAGVFLASPVAWSGSAKDVFQTVAPSVVVVLGLGEDGATGGGLFNGSGELVGITTFKWKGENLNFALPVEWVRELTQLGQQRLTAEQRRSACLEVPDFDCVIELARKIENSFSAWLDIVAVQLEVGDKHAAGRYLNTLFTTAKSMDKGVDRDQLLNNIAEWQVQAGAFMDALATTRSIDSIHFRIWTWAWVGPEIAKAQLESGDTQAAKRTRRILRNVLAEFLKEVQSQGIDRHWLLPRLLVVIAMAQAEADDKQAARQTLTLALKTFEITKAKRLKPDWTTMIRSIPSLLSNDRERRLGKRGRLIRALKDLVPVLVEGGEIIVAYYTAQAVYYNYNSQEFGNVLKSMARSRVEPTDITVLFKALKTDTFYGFGFFVREVAAAQLEAANISALLTTAKTATDAGYGRWFFGLAGFAWGDIARSQVAAAEIVASFRTAKEMSRGWTGDLDRALREVVAAQVKLGDIAAALTTVEGIDAAGDRAVAYTHIAKTQAKSGDREVARKTFGAAFEAARGMEKGFNRVKALRDILEAHVEVGQVAGARKVAENIVAENMEPLDSDFISAWTSARIATAEAKSGDSGMARKAFAAALKTAQGMEDEARRDAALMAIVQSQLEVDDVAGARNALASFRSGLVLVRALTWIALAEAKSGDLEVARKTFAAALEAVQSLENPSGRDAVLMDIVVSQLEVGDMAGARDTSMSFRSDSLLAEALTSIALAEAKSGHKQAARQDFAAALETVRDMKDVSERDSKLWRIAEAQSSAGDVVGALKNLFRIENVEGYQIREIAPQAKTREILAIAERLDRGPKRDSVLRTIIRTLLDDEQIGGALKAAEYMDDGQLRRDALVEIIQKQQTMRVLEKGDFADALDTVQRVLKSVEYLDDGQLRHEALMEIILAKVEIGDFTGALDTAQRMSDEPVSVLHMGRSGWVSSILERYATQQAKAGKFRDAMQTAMGIKDPHSRFSSLLRVAVSLKGHSERFPIKGTEDVEASLNLEPSDRTLIQRGLASFNINVGPADGIFGPRTRKALRSWQAKEGLDETGYLTREQAVTLIEAGKAAQRAGDEGGLTFKEGLRRDAP